MLEKKLFASILSSDFGELKEEVKRVEYGGVDGIHIDVMDGHFVNNLSYGFPVIKTVRKITKLPIDVHLMISNPENWIDRYCDEGIDYLSVHFEAVVHLDEVLKRIKSKKVKSGIAFNPSSNYCQVSPYIFNEISDFVLFMSVNPGFGGQNFIKGVLENVTLFRKSYPSLDIEIDGGIDYLPSIKSSAYLSMNNGANLFVAGSSIFQSRYREENYKTPIDLLKREINSDIAKNF